MPYIADLRAFGWNVNANDKFDNNPDDDEFNNDDGAYYARESVLKVLYYIFICNLHSSSLCTTIILVRYRAFMAVYSFPETFRNYFYKSQKYSAVYTAGTRHTTLGDGGPLFVLYCVRIPNAKK